MHHYIYHCSFCIQPILVIKFDSISGGDADGFVLMVSAQLQEFFVVKSALQHEILNPRPTRKWKYYPPEV